MVGFLFGGDTQETAESLKRKRAIAEALMENAVNDVPQNIGEGLSVVGQALAGRILTNRLEKKEKEGRAAATGLFNKAIAGFGGGDAATEGTVPMTDAADEAARTAPGGSSVDLSGDRQSFIAGLLPAAMEESKRTGVDPRIIVAQAAQETGWGKSAPGNNFFGIKSHGKGGGNSMMTTEVIDGKPVRVRDSFRAYSSPADSVRGYGDFILANPRYSDFRSAQGLDAQLAALQASGYATDPNYSRSVGAIARGIQLPQDVAAATPEAAFSAVMPELGGATIDDPMLVYDDKGARMEPASYARTERQNPYSGPGASIDTSGSTQAGGAQPSAVVQALANTDIPAEFQQSAQLRNAMGNGRGVIQALLEGTPATDAQLGQARVRGNAVHQALASPVRADNGLGIDPAVVDLLDNPYASDGQRAMLQTFISDKLAERKARREAELKRADPNYVLQGEKARLELDNLRNPLRELDMRAQRAGLVPGSKEYNEFMLRDGKGPLVSVNTGSNSSKFVEKSDEAAAGRMNDIVLAGQSAPQTMADMQQLLDLGAQIGTGPGAQIKAALGPYAQQLGIDIANMPEIQAYEAITARLAPQMRAVGSGSSSDRDVALFFQSLPNLRNTQGGNEIIANTMQAVAQNKINAAEIARRAQRGEISWQDADKQISELPNPYDLFKQFQAKGTPSAEGGGSTKRLKFNPASGELE